MTNKEGSILSEENMKIVGYFNLPEGVYSFEEYISLMDYPYSRDFYSELGGVQIFFNKRIIYSNERYIVYDHFSVVHFMLKSYAMLTKQNEIDPVILSLSNGEYEVRLRTEDEEYDLVIRNEERGCSLAIFNNFLKETDKFVELSRVDLIKIIGQYLQTYFELVECVFKVPRDDSGNIIRFLNLWKKMYK